MNGVLLVKFSCAIFVGVIPHAAFVGKMPRAID
jgi:hypothetical protein